MKKNILQILKIIIFAIILSVGVSFIYAQSWSWQDPIGNPPSNNVPAPLNTTTNAQVKYGGLLLDQDPFFFDIGFMVFSDPGDFGKVGIGTSSDTEGTVPIIGKVTVGGGSDAELVGGGYVAIGSLTGTNIVIDDDEIMARDNYGTSPLYIQKEGGDTIILAPSGVRIGVGQGDLSYSKLQVDGNIGATGWVGAGCEASCYTGDGFAILHASGDIQSSQLTHNLEPQNVCADNNGNLIVC